MVGRGLVCIFPLEENEVYLVSQSTGLLHLDGSSPILHKTKKEDQLSLIFLFVGARGGT